eukprot:1103026-Pyramimonas_sp.AAC.1
MLTRLEAGGWHWDKSGSTWILTERPPSQAADAAKANFSGSLLRCFLSEQVPGHPGDRDVAQRGSWAPGAQRLAKALNPGQFRLLQRILFGAIPAGAPMQM